MCLLACNKHRRRKRGGGQGGGGQAGEGGGGGRPAGNLPLLLPPPPNILNLPTPMLKRQLVHKVSAKAKLHELGV